MTKYGSILHLDMDAFYAAIEQLDHPELRGKPVVVGGPAQSRGVVSTASYEARVFGVHSAMPTSTALRLCPQAIFVPVRMQRYAEVSEQLMTILTSFTPMVEPLSIDEAFMDVSGVRRLWPDVPALARAMKQRIRDELQLTASVGIAGNKYLAKLASDMHKPDGLTIVPTDPAEVLAFLAPLPVTRIWGVGRRTAERLLSAGHTTIGQLQQVPAAALVPYVGKAAAAHIALLARGLDARVVTPESEEKSISNEHTFAVDCRDMEAVKQCLLELTENVGRRLRRAGRLARTAHIKLRSADFHTITRQLSFDPPTDNDRRLLGAAAELLRRERVRYAVRLVGFGVSGLLTPAEVEATREPTLFPEQSGERETARNAQLDKAVDTLREKFGSRAIRRGKGA